MFNWDLERKFYSFEEIKDMGLPIIDYDKFDCEEPTITWFTFTDLKKILKIYLSDDERKNAVVAFEKVPNGRGYVPLYCFESVLTERLRGK